MTARLFATLGYRDARAALAWLAALGFTEVRRQETPEGQVLHAEVRWGDAVLVVAGNGTATGADDAADAGAVVRPPTTCGLYLRVPDVDGAFERAVAAGARPVLAPERTIWHTRQARVVDPGGQEWTFGTYEPGVGW
ncbi:VOC family protein [Geodermatophilus marinus]|uniref:VOC family protein n=1 Tax=Geodermatophilus sp. LHW52908 TaxID=2303986 RepID=UPI000E3BA698|nr:VOC family protein [Geodermatophilus sp. LHW52908]RFU18892.1 bleomycin resistance protein [Geodermatophilus sp. LHW52908]